VIDLGNERYRAPVIERRATRCR